MRKNDLILEIYLIGNKLYNYLRFYCKSIKFTIKILFNNKLIATTMECKFIELTEKNGSKVFINILHIAWIEPIKDGTSIKSNFIHYSFPKNVIESYEEVKLLIEK